VRFGSDIFCNRDHSCHSTIRYDVLDDCEAHFYETRQLCDYAVDLLYQRKLVRLVMYMDPRCGFAHDYDVVLTKAGKAARIDSLVDPSESPQIENKIRSETHIIDGSKDDTPF